jgi:bifunctional non-homologous end joining protein LigD
MPTRVRRYNPQLATLTDTAPSGAEWIHELKYDGYRIGAVVSGASVRLESRREIDWTARFPEVVEAVRKLGCRSAVIDGEVAVTEPSGRTSFQKLQNTFEKGGAREGLTYYIFDLLELDDVDLRKLPLEERKALLEKLVGNRDSLIKYSRHFEGDGPHILEHACRLGCEGIVSKRRGDRYRGGRGESWLKTKCVQRREFVIGGYTDPEGSRVGIGSLPSERRR